MDSKYNYYIPNYKNPSGYMDIGEYKVPIPEMPPPSDIINFGKPAHLQKFQYTEIPESLKAEKSKVTKAELEFITHEHHKKFNGEWQYINGKAYYFTGYYYWFLNYWKIKSMAPEFRLVQSFLALFWEMCRLDPKCLGMLLLKGRRIGGTEFTISTGCHDTFYRRSAFFGLQNKSADDAQASFTRLNEAYDCMIWFMRPTTRGSNSDNTSMILKHPLVQNTEKGKLRNIKNNESTLLESKSTSYKYKPLNSKIQTAATVTTAFDGRQLTFYTISEFAKLGAGHTMNPVECWEIVRLTLSLNMGTKVIGKGILESSVEKISSGKGMKYAKYLWKSSDITKKSDNGFTITGLYRLFIPITWDGELDEFGCTDISKNEKIVKDEIDFYIRQGDFAALAAYKRKNPLFLEDCFSDSSNGCVLNYDRLVEAEQIIDMPDFKDPFRRGNLYWINGVRFGQVGFIENPKGRWNIRWLPEIRNHKLPGNMPGNKKTIAVGIDPINISEGSSIGGGCVVHRLLDIDTDGKSVYKKDDLDMLTLDEGYIGMPYDLGRDYTSDIPVCTYLNRGNGITGFMDDMLMTCLIYGSDMLYERSNTQLQNHFESSGFRNFVSVSTKEYGVRATDPYLLSKGSKDKGMSPTPTIIAEYKTLLEMYSTNMPYAIKEKTLIGQLKELSENNQNTLDLSVAFGFALMHADAKMKKYNKLFLRGEQVKENITKFAIDYMDITF